MKAQMVKNALIVPVGAKGGFVVKQPPADRDALRDEVVECYRTFISGLLDITDNIVEEDVVPPPNVVRYDEDDPYLVVAADKGTATFSDIANDVAARYGHWLGDAFASGGSAGYDHKKMGITARSAWESVKRHFRVLDTDIQSTDFTVAGVGDMSGDVFGNGMLLSRHIKLVAAFDHRHVFLDPDPDTEASFAERERLFALPRSSWADYDTSLLSEGGGIWPRTAKSIPLSEQAREMLGVDAERMNPSDLIRAVLCAPVDLLWNGGIGTYIKASTETHADAGGQGQRLRARQCRRVALPCGGGGRQPRADPARADRVRARWPADQHRRDRQRGRRELLRPRGQHQGLAQLGRHRRRDDERRARHAAQRDDRRRRRAAIDSGPTRDLYLVLTQLSADGTARLAVFRQHSPIGNGLTGAGRKEGHCEGASASAVGPKSLKHSPHRIGNVNRMHRRPQVSRSHAVTRRAISPGIVTKTSHGASRLTEAGARDDIRSLPVQRGAAERRAHDGQPRGQTTSAHTGAAAAGR